MGFFRQDLRGNLHTWYGTKKKIFLQISGNKHSKMTQILKLRAYLMQNFMEIDIKKFSDHKALTFGV